MATTLHCPETHDWRELARHRPIDARPFQFPSPTAFLIIRARNIYGRSDNSVARLSCRLAHACKQVRTTESCSHADQPRNRSYSKRPLLGEMQSRTHDLHIRRHQPTGYPDTIKPWRTSSHTSRLEPINNEPVHCWALDLYAKESVCRAITPDITVCLQG